MEPVADLRERNLGIGFDTVLDHDGDGVVTAADFERFGADFCDEIGVPDGPTADALRAAFRSWWEQLSAVCDQDGDGRITRQEWVTAYLSDPEAYSRDFSRIAELTAEAADIDGDGFIEQAEYVRMFQRNAGLGDQVFLAAFQRLDQDGDGRISTQEFQAACAQFFLSHDPADPGTGMLGPA